VRLTASSLDLRSEQFNLLIAKWSSTVTMPTNSPETIYTSRIQTWLKHIHALAKDIGPRGPTTDGERQGHIYCQQTLDRLGHHSQWERFRAARSIFTPHLIASLAMLAAFVIYPLAGRTSALVAALIAALSLASELLELSFISNPIRWMVPKGESQNVFAVQEPSGEHKQDLILIGHVDSKRTPLIFKSTGWLSAYQTFTTVAFAAFAVMVALYTLGIFTQWSWILPVSAVSALCAVLLAALCIQADLTPFTDGANDNATAVGLVLTLAEHLQAEPLAHTRVWLVNTGCEDVQHYGAINFLDWHLNEFKNPHALVFEMLGCSGPGWLVKEGIIIPFKATLKLVELAEKTNAAHPELDGYPVSISGGNTEMADALRRGIPTLTLFGMTRENIAPYWHQVGDTVDKIDPAALERNYAFTWHFLRALDEAA